MHTLYIVGVPINKWIHTYNTYMYMHIYNLYMHDECKYT